MAVHFQLLVKFFNGFLDMVRKYNVSHKYVHSLFHVTTLFFFVVSNIVQKSLFRFIILYISKNNQSISCDKVFSGVK